MVRDPLGFPVCRITADYKENERKLAAFVQDKMEQWYKAAGAIATIRNPVGSMGPTTHAYGGTRMGGKTENNTGRPWGFSPETPKPGNLRGSAMGASGAPKSTPHTQTPAWGPAAPLA